MPDLDLAVSTSEGPRCGACSQDGIIQWQRRVGPDAVAVVYGCAVHAISVDAAARVHQPECPAPDPAVLPACGCAPEPLPGVVTPGGQAVVTLPTGWVIPAN